MIESIEKKISSSIKWTTLTEVGAKLVAPLSSMVLARLLTPEAFGVVSSLSIVVSFSEIIADAGFQKYMIQHEFETEDELSKHAHVAFWSNISFACLLWIIIACFRDSLASMVGSPGLGMALMVAALSIPISSFGSIHVALLKRTFDFKSLFKVRMVGVMVPLFVTIPLSLYWRDYWALIVGTLVFHLVGAIALVKMSSWHPSFFYSCGRLRNMLSFSVWSIFESVSIWFTGYVDLFVVGTMLSQYHLGLYKTSIMVVGQVMGVVTSVTTPVLFSALSRVQQNSKTFCELFLRFQKMVALFVMPLGAILYCYKNSLTQIFLGNQWLEASDFIGLWGFSSSWVIVFSHYASEVYRSLGKPKLSAMAQWLHIIVLWPAVWWAANKGMETLCEVRTLVRLEAILINVILLWLVVRIKPWSMVRNVMASVLATLLLSGVVILFKTLYPTIGGECCALLIGITAYVGFLWMFPQERQLLKMVKNHLSQRIRI